MATWASTELDGLRQAAVLMLWLLVGVVLGFHPALLHGWSVPLAGYPDSELVSFTLEHVHRCWFGSEPCASLVRLPVFHPFALSGALTELQLPVVPIFSVFRLAGFGPGAALVLTLLAQSIFSFLLVVALLRRGLAASPFEAGFGACLVAFGSAKMARIYHAHLFSQLPLLLALLLAQRLLARESSSQRAHEILAIGALLSLQLYSSVNIAVAAAFFCSVITIVACGFAAERQRLWATVASRPITWGLSAAIGALASWPLIALYSRVREVVEPLDLDRLAALLPRPSALLNQGSRSWFGDELAQWTGLPGQDYSWEFNLGLGIGATALVLIGAASALRRTWLRALLLASAASWLLVIRWPGGFSAWPVVTALLPPLEVLRSPARLHLLLLPVLAATAILGLRRLGRGGHPWSRAASVILTAIVVLEQGRNWGMLARPGLIDPQQLAARIPPDCDSFFLSTHGAAGPSHEAHLAAMRAAAASGIPTLNGYSGYRPRGWRLGNVEENTPFTTDLQRRIEQWRETSGLEGDTCWLVAEINSPSSWNVRVLRLAVSGSTP